MQDGWSLKKLHRLLLLSSAYQRKSDDNLRYETMDPDNRLLSKANRQRLDFESMRNTLLLVAGNLDPPSNGSTTPRNGFTTSTNVSINAIPLRKKSGGGLTLKDSLPRPGCKTSEAVWHSRWR